MTSSVPSSRDTVLVWRIGNIGDTVVAIPAFRALRRHFKDEKLVLMTSPCEPGRESALDVVGPAGIFDAFVTYVPRDLRKGARLRELIGRIRDLSPRAVFCMDFLFAGHWRTLRNAAFFKLTGCRNVHGLHLGGLTSERRRRIAATGVYPRETDRLMSIVAEAGVKNLAVDFDLGLTAEERRQVDELWRRRIPDRAGPVVAMSPGAGVPVNQWPTERFVSLARRLVGEAGAHIVVVGGGEDRELGKRFGSECRNVVNLAGLMTVRETHGILGRCDLYVGNNTGAMHLAAAAGTRCVAVFSARDRPESWHPYGEGHVVLGARPDCTGCMKRSCPTAHCILSVEVDEVLTCCLRALGRRP